MPIRVLVLTKSLGVGGAERLIVTSLSNRDRSAFDYEVAYVRASEGALAGEARRTGVTVHDLGARGDHDLRWMLRLRRILLTGNFDVVHSHLPYSVALGRIVVASLPRRRRPLLMSTQHADWTSTARSVRLLNRATVGLDRLILAVSDSTQASLPPAARRRSTVLIHGIDRARVDLDDPVVDVRAELGLAPGEGLVVTVAKLRPEKGHEVLLDAAALLRRRGAPARFVVAGDGPHEALLRERHEALGLGDRFKFLGHRDDVRRLVAAADVFVLPSRGEGLPVALMEAMSLGAAVVVTAVGGVPDVIEAGRNGILVPPQRPDLLADAIEELLQDPQRREQLSEAARITAGRFDAVAATATIEDHYRRLVG